MTKLVLWHFLWLGAKNSELPARQLSIVPHKMPTDLCWKIPTEEAEIQTGIIWQDHGNRQWHACFCPADFRTRISAQRKLCWIGVGWPYPLTQSRKRCLTIKAKQLLERDTTASKASHGHWKRAGIALCHQPAQSHWSVLGSSHCKEQKTHGSGWWHRFIGSISHSISRPTHARAKN